jgi:hypothetical protein
LREALQVSPFKTDTRPYKGSSIPLWIVFWGAFAVVAWQFAIGKAPSELISLSAFVVLSISGCALFIAIINYFNHDPVKVTVTSHAIRIDTGEDQMIIRLIDLIEIQRSRRWLMDEIVLKAIGDRGFSLENLREPDEFLSAIVTNASSAGNRRSHGRAASFSLVTKHSNLKLQEVVGRKRYGGEANSLELSNNFTAYLLTLPFVAILPSLLVSIATFLLLATFKMMPITAASLGAAALIGPSLYLIICYVLFVEKQIAITENEIVIESSTDRIVIAKNSITRVYSRRAGLSRVIKIETKTQGTVTLRGYSNPDGIEGAIRWVTTSSEVRNNSQKDEIQGPSKSPAEIYRNRRRADQ